MISEYLIHNQFRVGLKEFIERDPHLASLRGLKFVHPLAWWRGIDWGAPGIYILTGGRQIGKTTSTKLLIKTKLEERAFAPRNILYLPCDQIDTHVQLGRTIRSFLDELSSDSSSFLLVVDEVTFVREWDRAIKALADEGRFRRGHCIITGSDSIVLREAMKRFPGRRGEAARTDFRLMPLSFREYVTLVDPKARDGSASNPDDAALGGRFEEYLGCGGHLRAINDLHSKGAVLPATYDVFEQWIAGDFDKRGRSERTLAGILQMIVETLGSQVTYSALANRMGEITKETFIDYCELLDRMDLIFTLQAYDQNRRIGFPKKARKIHFWDPFILDTVQRWLVREGRLPDRAIDDSIKAESIAAAHFKARMPTFYIKGRGEIDVVALAGRRVVACEVKWTQQLRPWDIGELKKYPGSVILTKPPLAGSIEDIPAVPLPRFLVTE